MARMVGWSVATPPHALGAEDVCRELGALLPERAAQRLPRLVAESRIRTRHVVAPLAELARLRSMDERNAAFLAHGLPLAAAAAHRALETAAVQPDDVIALVCVGSTSHLVPSLDTHLIRALGLAPTCRRIPISQLGCSGGVGGLGLAAEMVGGDPARNVLLVCAELPSLSLPLAEPSLADVASCALLADGAAAVVVGGGSSGRGPEVVATRSVLFPESREGGGARLTEGGFRMVQAIGLPRLARRRLPEALDGFLAAHGAAREQLAFWAINPRSPQILEATADALCLSDADLAPTWDAWERHGNTISATVVFILESLRQRARPAEGALGMALSFGAGVTCEMALLRWRDPV